MDSITSGWGAVNLTSSIIEKKKQKKYSAKKLVRSITVRSSVKQILAKSKSLELIFGGDVTFYGPIDYHFKNGDCSYERPFQDVKGVFAEADFTMINLETTLGEVKDFKNNATEKLITFISDPQALVSLR